MVNTLKNIGIAVIFCLITHKAKNIACFATPNASLDRYFDVLFSIHNRSITFSDRNCLVALFWLQSTQKMSMHIKKHPAYSFQGLLTLLYYRHGVTSPLKIMRQRLLILRLCEYLHYKELIKPFSVSATSFVSYEQGLNQSRIER